MSVGPNPVKKTNWSNVNLQVNNLEVINEINNGLIAQIQSAAAGVQQLQSVGVIGDFYVRGHLYQALGEAWSGLIANPFGATGISSISY